MPITTRLRLRDAIEGLIALPSRVPRTCAAAHATTVFIDGNSAACVAYM